MIPFNAYNVQYLWILRRSEISTMSICRAQLDNKVRTISQYKWHEPDENYRNGKTEQASPIRIIISFHLKHAYKHMRTTPYAELNGTITKNGERKKKWMICTWIENVEAFLAFTYLTAERRIFIVRSEHCFSYGFCQYKRRRRRKCIRF